MSGAKKGAQRFGPTMWALTPQQRAYVFAMYSLGGSRTTARAERCATDLLGEVIQRREMTDDVAGWLAYFREAGAKKRPPPAPTQEEQEATDLETIQQLKLTDEPRWLAFLRETRPTGMADHGQQWRLLRKDARDRIAAHWQAISDPLKSACAKTGRSFDKRAEAQVKAGVVAAAIVYRVKKFHIQKPTQRADPLGDIKDAAGKLLALLVEADKQGLRYDLARAGAGDGIEYLAAHQLGLDWLHELIDSDRAGRAEAKHRDPDAGRPDSGLADFYRSLARVFCEVTGLAPGGNRGKAGAFTIFVQAVLGALEVGLSDATVVRQLRGLFGADETPL